MKAVSAEQVGLLLHLDRHAEAEEAARNLIASDAEAVEGYYCLADVLNAMERYPEALDVSAVVLEKAPNWSTAHQQRAAIMSNLGRKAEALRHAKAAVELDPDDSYSHTCLASAHFDDGQLDKFREAVAHGRSLFPEDLSLLYYQGLLVLCDENYRELGAVAKEGLRLSPDDPRFHNLAGLAAALAARDTSDKDPDQRRRYERAERRFAEALRLDPTNRVFRYLRKNSARESRINLVATILTVWLFAVIGCSIFLPPIIHGAPTPCWCWLFLPVGGWLLGLILGGLIPEFALVIPVWGKYPITIPLFKEERRKGWLLWLLYAIVTLAIVFAPMQFVGP